MSRTWFLCFLAFAALMGGLLSLNGAQAALSLPILLFLGYAALTAPTAPQLEVLRTLSAERALAGIPVQVKLRVTNAGADLEELILEDALPEGLQVTQGSTRHLIHLGRGQTYEFDYSVVGPRGGYGLGLLRATASDALGLLPSSAVTVAAAKLVVLPMVTRLKDVPIRPRRTRVYAGAIPARVGGPGVEFFGLRQYGPGDSARHINWRVMARHPENLYANEFQQERVGDVAIVLDGRQRVELRAGAESLFEHSVTAAGSLATALLRDGNRVGLLVYSQYLKWTMPGYGRMQRERILYALAAAAPGGSQIFEGLQHLPTRLFPPESQIVLVSPILEDDLPAIVQIRARGYAVLIVSPDPVTFEVASLRRASPGRSTRDIDLAGRIVRLERAALFGRLRRAGVQLVEWNVAQPFDQAMLGAFRRVRATRAPA